MHIKHSRSLAAVLVMMPVLAGCTSTPDNYKNVWNGNVAFGPPAGPVLTDL